MAPRHHRSFSRSRRTSPFRIESLEERRLLTGITLDVDQAAVVINGHPTLADVAAALEEKAAQLRADKRTQRLAA